jgi:hypothetical protein
MGNRVDGASGGPAPLSGPFPKIGHVGRGGVCAGVSGAARRPSPLGKHEKGSGELHSGLPTEGTPGFPTSRRRTAPVGPRLRTLRQVHLDPGGAGSATRARRHHLRPARDRWCAAGSRGSWAMRPARRGVAPRSTVHHPTWNTRLTVEDGPRARSGLSPFSPRGLLSPRPIYRRLGTMSTETPLQGRCFPPADADRARCVGLVGGTPAGAKRPMEGACNPSEFGANPSRTRLCADAKVDAPDVCR